jgi:beta-lactamase regulating signal transducer with metallopeptidase domain
MNDLGIELAWSAVQVTLLAVAAAAVYPFAARRPALAAAVAAAGVGGAVVLTVLTLCPLPSWWGWRAPEAAPPAPPTPAASSPPAAAEADAGKDTSAVSADGPAWPAGMVRWTWQGAGSAVAPFRDHAESHWGVVAVVALAGAAISLLRLGAGLWAVADLRRRSRPVLDAAPCRFLRQLRQEMGCRVRPELREVSGFGAPAVAGWLRPVVLLPAEWRGWSEPELRAALAHELAHVRRSDYLLGLLAQLGLALHFYHPLLHWLAGRLRLQQELAADALAAPFAGGRDAYLRGLARLALRLDDRRSAGWPANPLLSRGTLMRRIRMLKITDGALTGPTPRWGRALAVALLAAAAVGAAAVRCPAQKTGDPQQVPATAPEDSPAERFFAGGFRSLRGIALRGAGQELAIDQPEPFDLSYLPPDAMGVVCFRPSAVLGRPGMKKYADEANKGIAAACKALELPRSFGLPVEDVSQVTMTVTVKTDKKAKGAQSALVFGAPVVFHTARDFAWAKELKELLPGLKEVRHGDMIYQLPTDGPLGSMLGGQSICCYVPDARTIVFDTEEHLARQLERKPGDAPPWMADFKRVERGLGAVVLDNRNGAWSHELAARDEPEPHVAPFQGHTSWVVAGVSADDGFVCDATARFDGEEIAEKAVKAVDQGLAAARDVLATPETFRAALRDKDDPPDDGKPMNGAEKKAHAFFKSLLQESELKRDGASVRLRCRAKCDATEILAAILEGEIGL